ncbi:MAG: O-antigen ligase family protein [Anaeromyxobacter sp.]|nr:O-antigen ligase family protein [Anaeromyxobacter sp.]
MPSLELAADDLPGPVGAARPAPALLLPALLILITAGTLLTGALVPRDLSLGEDAPIWNASPDQLAFDLSRAATALVLLASGVAAARATVLHGFPRAGLALWLAYLGFVATNFLLPGLAAREPGLDARLLLPPIVFTGAYFARPIPPARLTWLAKVVLGAFVHASLAAAVLAPAQALAPYLEGVLPGLPVRLYGVGGGATSLGALSSAFLALELCAPSRSRWRLLHLGAAGLALLLTQAKTSWLFVLLVVALLLARRTWRLLPALGLGGGASARATWVLLLGGVGGALVGLLAAGSGHVQVASLQGGDQLLSLTGRTYIWATSWRTWLESPLFGYGLGLWESERFRATYGPFDHAHNQLLHALASAGVVGLLGLLGYLGVALAGALRAARRSPLPLVLLGAVLSLCLTNTPLRAYYVLDAFVLLHLLLFAALVDDARLAAARR